MKLSAAVAHTRWEETTLLDLEGGQKITRASVGFEYSGENINGKSDVEYLMYYRESDPNDPHAAKATYAGFVNFTGAIEGKAGSFVMKELGEYSGGSADSKFNVVEGSGTAELSGITGTATFSATGKDDKMLFDVEF